MQRLPEPELMDDPAQVLAYVGDDLAGAAWLFLNCFRKNFQALPARGAILDLGCGPGRIALGLARRYPGWQVDGIDGSLPMLEHGREKARESGLDARVHLVQGMLPGSLPLPRNRYEAVVSNSFLHHLGDPLDLWRTIRARAQPGAAVLVIDLLRPPSLEEADSLVERCFPKAPDLLRRDFHASLLAAYSLEEIEAQLREAGLAEMLALTKPTPFQFAACGTL
jgi:SAM-dependent methyltransferase